MTSGKNNVTSRPSGGVRIGLTVLAGAALVALFLAAGPGAGIGQEKGQSTPPPEKPKAQWSVASHDRTNFPLVGKHRTLACADCHIKGVLEGTPMACEACHWERQQDDRYRLRLGMACGDCHTPLTWKKVDPNKWNHETVTGFKLEGAHKFLDCEDCHGAQGFKVVPQDCYSCHIKNYQGTTDPNHAQAGFPTDCLQCHNTRSWSGAVFNHTTFVLQGKHRTAACADCHKNGVYAGTPTACASCHLTDYNNTTDPNHQQAGYSLDCTTCHGTSAQGWSGATVNHTVFVLLGRHLTAACTDCHKNGVYAGTPTACASCHIDQYNSTTDPNHKALGYSLECQTCHGTSASGWNRRPKPGLDGARPGVHSRQ